MNLPLIDVSGWLADDDFATYPEGARDKRAYFPPDNCEFGFIRRDRRHLFKLSDKRYPEQFWGEVVAYHIGKMIGVEAPRTYAAIDRASGEAGALIEWVYADREHLFVLGGLFMQATIKDFDMRTGRQHNFEQIRVLCRALSLQNPAFDKRWLETWAKGMIFDALIGNTDRHQNNWGVLFSTAGETPSAIGFAPWFDNGTSLGCDRWPTKVDRWSDEVFVHYLHNGKHHLRWNRATDERCGFFEMPRLLLELDAGLRAPMMGCLTALDLDEVAELLAQCQAIPSYVPLTPWRAAFMHRLIARRQEILMKVLS